MNIQSDVAPLQTVLVRRPDAAFGNAEPVRWHYVSQPDLDEAQKEHDALVRLLREHSGAEVVYHVNPLPDHADAIYVRDPVLMCAQGAIILQMGKDLRRGEERALEMTLTQLGIPIHARLTGEATAEGGDLLWIDAKTLAVGVGFRTNMEGVRQLQAALPNVDVLPFHLPYGDGPDACLHLMSFVSMIDDDLAVVHLSQMPVPFYQLLVKRGIKMVEVPGNEYQAMATNVLALGPRKCLMLDGNPVTKARLEAAGCKVWTYKGEEISRKAEGGPTCLTRPIARG
jgi:N-dimethylarginine dimethylaminohydrolase